MPRRNGPTTFPRCQELGDPCRYAGPGGRRGASGEWNRRGRYGTHKKSVRTKPTAWVFVITRLELMTKECGIPRGHWRLPKLQKSLLFSTKRPSSTGESGSSTS